MQGHSVLALTGKLLSLKVKINTEDTEYRRGLIIPLRYSAVKILFLIRKLNNPGLNEHMEIERRIACRASGLVC